MLRKVLFTAAALSGLFLQGCAVIAVADAVITVAAVTVKTGAEVVGATAHVAASGVKALTKDKEEEPVKK
jgi:hypothetical protein